MSKPAIDLKRMNDIIEKTITTIDSGRKEIFEIAENARKECERIKNELTSIQQKISLIILEVEQLEEKKEELKQNL